jgi:ACS family hexuronate transporter-like MFS transporter
MPEGQSDSTFAMVKVFVADRRFWILLTMVVTINLSWQFLRAWMPPFLGEARSYSPVAISLFSSLYYLVADFGSIACGALALGLSTRLGVQGARRLVFLMGALACLASIPAAILPAGRTLEIFLLLLGFGSLGVFPIYYSQCQEFPARWQGRVSGILGSLTWVTVFMLQIAMGTWVSSTKASFLASELAVGLEPAEAARAAAAHAYTLGFALAGLPPLLGFAALMCWPTQPKTETHGPTGTA